MRLMVNGKCIVRKKMELIRITECGGLRIILRISPNIQVIIKHISNWMDKIIQQIIPASVYM